MNLKVTPYAEKTNSIPTVRGKHPVANHTSSPHMPLSMRYNYRTKPQQNSVRIDTCIVGDDSTCDVAQNEFCKTDSGVSSCHCRPGMFSIFFIKQMTKLNWQESYVKIVSNLWKDKLQKSYSKLTRNFNFI